MTEASGYLVALAARIAAAYVAQTRPRAILLTGSAAEGVSDYYSDLDLMAYYDQLPTADQLAAARELLQVTDLRIEGHRSGGGCSEDYLLQGVECQVAHFTTAMWEGYWATVLEDCSVVSGIQKAVMGVVDGVPLHGDDLIRGWQTRFAAYPDQLGLAMVEHYLTFFPLWESVERFDARDAKLFYYQSLVEASQNLLGVLAGLNRLYYSTFQFKRMRRFVGRMRLVPERFADRLDALFSLDPAAAGTELERLVEEIVALVETHMPTVDTAPVRRRIGLRQRPWTPVVGSGM
jgi:hypothetical protein